MSTSFATNLIGTWVQETNGFRRGKVRSAWPEDGIVKVQVEIHRNRYGDIEGLEIWTEYIPSSHSHW